MKMTEKEMIRCIAVNSPWLIERYDAVIPNCYTAYDNEADLFCMRKSGLCDEIEIKVSKADFRLDEKKTVRVINEGKKSRKKTAKRDAMTDGKMSNYFWYAYPIGLVDREEIPEWAGIIEVNPEVMRGYVVRSPKRLHGGKMTYEERFKQARKLGYRFWKKF